MARRPGFGGRLGRARFSRCRGSQAAVPQESAARRRPWRISLPPAGGNGKLSVRGQSPMPRRRLALASGQSVPFLLPAGEVGWSSRTKGRRTRTVPEGELWRPPEGAQATGRGFLISFPVRRPTALPRAYHPPGSSWIMTALIHEIKYRFFLIHINKFYNSVSHRQSPWPPQLRPCIENIR